MQNILPYGVGSYTQTNSSNLVDAYKRNQLHASSGVRHLCPECHNCGQSRTSEALKANLVWSKGLEQPTYLVSSRQLEKFRTGGSVEQETDVKAEKGAYFIQAKVSLQPNEKQEWRIIANVNQDHSALFDWADKIKGDSALLKNVQDDIELGPQT